MNKNYKNRVRKVDIERQQEELKKAQEMQGQGDTVIKGEQNNQNNENDSIAVFNNNDKGKLIAEILILKAFHLIVIFHQIILYSLASNGSELIAWCLYTNKRWLNTLFNFLRIFAFIRRKVFYILSNTIGNKHLIVYSK